MKKSLSLLAALAVLALAAEASAGPGGQGGAGGAAGGGAPSGGAGPVGGGGEGGAVSGDQDGDGFTAAAGDCNDLDYYVHPGAYESCNGQDDDCDDLVDEDVGSTWYRDDDGDGYGLDTDAVTTCSEPSGYTSQGGDCRDDQFSVNPDAYENCDGRDNDCNGKIDDYCNANLHAGATPSAELVSGALLAAWLGIGAWRRRRQERA